MMNKTFQITRSLQIDAAHRVPDHNSKCFNLHGHRYVIEATVEGELYTSGEQKGMVMDFGFLKACMVTAIHDPCDHGTIFFKDDPMVRSLFPNWSERDFSLATEKGQPITTGSGWKIHFMPWVPTAENLASWWCDRLDDAIQFYWEDNEMEGSPPDIKQIAVHETPNCMAVYAP